MSDLLPERVPAIVYLIKGGGNHWDAGLILSLGGWNLLLRPFLLFFNLHGKISRRSSMSSRHPVTKPSAILKARRVHRRTKSERSTSRTPSSPWAGENSARHMLKGPRLTGARRSAGVRAHLKRNRYFKCKRPNFQPGCLESLI